MRLHTWHILSLSLLFAFFLIFTLALPVFSSGSSNSAASFLKIPVGAKPASLGEAYSCFDNDPTLIFYNPAGISWLQKPFFSFGHSNYIENVKYEYLALSLPHKKKWSKRYWDKSAKYKLYSQL